MRKRILYCVAFALFFAGSTRCDEAMSVSGRGLFVTTIQDPPVLSSENQINKLIDFAKSTHIKVLFVQIYRSGQAWFPSKIADSHPYEACLKKVSEDPFALLIRQAHAAGIEVHAWLNMLSLGDNQDAIFIKRYGTGVLTKNLKAKKTLADYKIDNQYFLEPGDPRVREALSKMVEEIIRTYPGLDGIQFDYIRYPDMNPAYGYTETNISRFKKTTGLQTIDERSQAWKDWKRDQVTELLGILVKRVRALRPDIKISATGCMPYSRAYYEAFQDWPSWIDRKVVDFVTVMNYSPYPVEFERWISAAKKVTVDFKKVNIGLGAYKLARAPGTFEKELRLCEKSGGGTCVIFHYGSLLQNPALGSLLIGGKQLQKAQIEGGR